MKKITVFAASCIFVAGFAHAQTQESSAISLPQVSGKPVVNSQAQSEQSLQINDGSAQNTGAAPTPGVGANVLQQPITDFGRAAALINQNPAPEPSQATAPEKEKTATADKKAEEGDKVNKDQLVKNKDKNDKNKKKCNQKERDGNYLPPECRD